MGVQQAGHSEGIIVRDLEGCVILCGGSLERNTITPALKRLSAARPEIAVRGLGSRSTRGAHDLALNLQKIAQLYTTMHEHDQKAWDESLSENNHACKWVSGATKPLTDTQHLQFIWSAISE